MKKKQFVMRDSDYFHDEEDIIRIESCASMKECCVSILPLLNKNLLLSRKLFENKEYPDAIFLLKDAFEAVSELTNDQCQRCKEQFREIILKHMETIVVDLREITTGLFANKNYRYDLEFAEEVFEELKTNQS
ncbi:MAG TPA: hypothetical protein VHO90_18735 [Bacteroidales bacterium]|nr:hypothetical protein [Bacteroidales bacterium]